MRVERCSFSWHKIYPGHGIRFVRGDSRLFIFAGSKARCCYDIKRSSRNTKWTGDWRKAHKKDISKLTKKRVKRRAVRFQKDIVGMTLEEIRNTRKAKVIEKVKGADAAALRELKERKAKVAGTKKVSAKQVKPGKQAKQGKQVKQAPPKAAPPKKIKATSR
ncbi:putative 60S ribosomal protein L24-1 [Monocercomonoides exilis]|uniref:putative 60S ribosomal protein L24-1 n=1 Tax=Monocercomonoides exilis TaxID=2049356 RepID=UPI0035593DAC|nr:putative 60S ribosomal protein L24-1 [Monocercomonoides exilis]|eukprot:MONOS_12081.1-p1 / transcript=MONOS_12081.1 / gene=MONOS_12081 / organism=Monocercomonoides_exilis_PA203 / gene_product=60S ribosomal protein L24-1 / transcript_product=60S ribosomal protein L24-1 / location=Mono_scaffold00643:19824-20427(-) / protein_length=162 / sequence_SO=supercontig / SO=protein_coding / is_pseudo=false